MDPVPAFRPPPGLGNPHVQSSLGSSRLRRWLAGGSAADGSRRWILDCGDGVRLQAHHDSATGAPAGAAAVLLHGWEGSSASSYVRSCAGRLLRAGVDVVRLDFRDHGETHHLNEGIFHSCRIDEVVGAVESIARKLAPRRLWVVGFSLGGNFALRVALRAPGRGPALAGVVAVSPVLDPAVSVRAMERAPRFYEWYFERKWRRSLARKQQAFPGRYDFGEWMRLRGLRRQTEHLVERFTDYESVAAYYDGYTIGGDRLAGLAVPATLIAAEDDPIIPVAGFRELQLPACASVEVTPAGGHNAFLDSYRLESWADRRVVREIFSPANR